MKVIAPANYFEKVQASVFVGKEAVKFAQIPGVVHGAYILAWSKGQSSAYVILPGKGRAPKPAAEACSGALVAAIAVSDLWNTKPFPGWRRLYFPNSLAT